MNRGKIIILSGPSGSGKTTIHERLLSSGRWKDSLVKSISVTTRPRRPGEKNGRDYLFTEPEDFQKKIREGFFLEWEKVFDNYYGTPKIIFRELLDKGKHVLLCIDVKGAKSVMEQFPGAVSVFISVPSLDELRRRLEQRGSEASRSLDMRIETARRELLEAGRYDFVVVNDDLDRACSELESILAKEIRPET